MTTGQRIKAARKAAGLTQADLANKVGVPYQSIGQWERDERNPKLETLERIAAALGVRIGYEKEQIIIPGRLKIITVSDPDLDDIQYRIEAEDAEAYQQGLQIIENAGVSIPAYTPTGRILSALSKLNDKGQAIAVERVEELTKIPDYQK